MNGFTNPTLIQNGPLESATDRNPPQASSRRYGCGPCSEPDGTRVAARNREKGAGHLKAIVFTLIMAWCVFVGFKVVPAMVNEYEFQDGIQDIARYAAAMRQDVGKVREAVLKEAQKDEVPITAEDVKIEGGGGNYQISADYSVIVDLKVYQWTLNFHPSVLNKSLF